MRVGSGGDFVGDSFPDNLFGKVFDGWVIKQKLGEGHSAVVFQANKAGAVAAVKVYRPDLTQESAVQLSRIRRQLSLKNHHHRSLVRVYAGGWDTKTHLYYLVMERLEGAPLDEVLQHVPIDRIRPLLAQVAGAARFLEDLDIVHRDIKPANILVDKDFRKATLLDLGVIRPIADSESNLTDSTANVGGFLGTLRYSPPEFLTRQEKHSKEGWRAITFYQLGAVLSDLVTGKRLFAHLKEREHWAKIVEAIKSEPPNLSEINIRPGVEPSLVTLAVNCLSKDWTDRLAIVKWSDFECRGVVRRPVVVLVYTGGTIGSTKEESGCKTRSLRSVENKTEPLLDAFNRRVRRDYEQLAGSENPMPFDLEWELLPKDQQLLSENASHETWDHLGAAVERICRQYANPSTLQENKEGECLAGIVLLHGTDTLAYSAAALSMSLRNLPCPLILTGSNQPPNEKSILEQDLIASESDAWKNILLSLHFIQAFGHRFTETFVCFDDTIHVAVNLRKEAIDAAPQPLQRERKLQEPYFYRNRGPQRQYAYRLIDGLYCNNFYPISDELRYDVLIHDQRNRYRHIRQSPWAPGEALVRSPFAGGVRLMTASPVALVPDGLGVQLASSATALQPGLSVLLLEGYSSGTFPTVETHSFHRYLLTLLRESVPIVLVTRNGLIPSMQRYEMAKIGGVELPVFRLFGLIAETAAPLLSLILATIPASEWTPAGVNNATELLRHRHAALEAAIRKRQAGPDGILTALLGDLLSEEDQRKARLDELHNREQEHMRRVTDLFAEARGVEFPNLPERGRRRFPRKNSFDPSKTIFLRQHFLWLLGEVVHSFENSNSGPDGLAFWNELGFAWGRQVRETLSLHPYRSTRALFARRAPAERRELVEAAKEQTETITQFLCNYGVAEVVAKLDVEAEPTEVERYRDGKVSLHVDAIKHGRGGRDDDLFAALGYGAAEADFFQTLRSGGDLTLTDSEFSAGLEKEFRNLFEHAWDLKVSPLDWFLIGAYKAMASSALRYLSFDPWVDRCDRDEPGHIEALRNSIRTEVIVADRGFFRLRLSYRGRDVHSQN
jgi:serine/threonine protein kinase